MATYFSEQYLHDLTQAIAHVLLLPTTGNASWDSVKTDTGRSYLRVSDHKPCPTSWWFVEDLRRLARGYYSPCTFVKDEPFALNNSDTPQSYTAIVYGTGISPQGTDASLPHGYRQCKPRIIYSTIPGYVTSTPKDIYGNAITTGMKAYCYASAFVAYHGAGVPGSFISVNRDCPNGQICIVLDTDIYGNLVPVSTCKAVGGSWVKIAKSPDIIGVFQYDGTNWVQTSGVPDRIWVNGFSSALNEYVGLHIPQDVKAFAELLHLFLGNNLPNSGLYEDRKTTGVGSNYAIPYNLSNAKTLALANIATTNYPQDPNSSPHLIGSGSATGNLLTSYLSIYNGQYPYTSASFYGTRLGFNICSPQYIDCTAKVQYQTKDVLNIAVGYSSTTTNTVNSPIQSTYTLSAAGGTPAAWWYNNNFFYDFFTNNLNVLIDYAATQPTYGCVDPAAPTYGQSNANTFVRNLWYFDKYVGSVIDIGTASLPANPTS